MAPKAVAMAELLFATMTWGFGFTATVWALRSFDSATISALRFSVGFLISLTVVIFSVTREELNRKNLILSFIPGIFLGFTLAFQTWGLEHTTATNSGFLTTLYVVIVPIMETFFLKKRLHYLHFLWVLIALFGTELLVNFTSAQLNRGDVYTLICAVLASVQIVWLGKISRQISSPFVFNTFQSLWATLAALLFLPIYGSPYHHFPISLLSVCGLISITVGSTILGFTLQVKAQKVLSPSLASLIFLLESPFAMLFAILFIGEKVTSTQVIGAVLIFLAALCATLFESKKSTV